MATDQLGEYSAKRKFEATPEPAPAVPAVRSGPLLFVIQQHSARRLHYDFRLEYGGVLKSWAVPKGPSLDPSEKRLAVQTEDHPYDYASFEGVIPPGQYGAGEVIVWDCGVYSPDEGDETWFHDRNEAERRAAEGLEKGKLSLLVRGEKLKGSFALVRTSEGKNWLLIKHKDRYASRVDVSAQDRSVLSGVTVEEAKVVPVRPIPASRLVPAGKMEAMPGTLAPMQAMPLSGLSIGAVGDRVVVKEGAARWQADSGQYLLAFEGDPSGGSLRVIERPVQAQEWLDRAIDLESTDTEAALRAYEQAVEADPTLLDARINLGSLLHETGRLADAERVYREAIEACGSDPLLLFNLGVLLGDTERKAEAVDAYEAALRGNPRLADCHYNLALLCQELCKPKEAIRHMAQYRKLTMVKS